jgi:methionyl-tRNA formyltransferase
MRLVMMGTGPFAVPTFRALVASPHDVAALVTRPARGKTRSSGPPDNPMRAAADELGIVVYEPENVNQTESVELLQSLQADLLVVCDYGQILRPSALATAARGGINLHGSLLPRHRGAAPVQWALICGDEETGVTVIHMTPQLDAGPCLVQVRTPIRADEDAQALEARLAEMGVDAVRDALDLLADWDGTSPLGWFQQVKRRPGRRDCPSRTAHWTGRCRR